MIIDTTFFRTMLVNHLQCFHVFNNYLTCGLFFYSAHVALVRLDARKGSALSVPIDEPLLDEPLLDEGESDRLDGLDDDGLIN